jgi:hypothetical protein
MSNGIDVKEDVCSTFHRHFCLDGNSPKGTFNNVFEIAVGKSFVVFYNDSSHSK